MSLRLLSIIALVLLSADALAQRVAFINPGRSDEVFWRTAGQAMQAAADSLGLRFEQQFAERDPARALALAEQIAARPVAERPDYVVLVNEKGVLVPAAQQLQAAGIKSFAAFSGLLPQERAQHGPRKGLPLLLGSLEPQAEHAGFMTAHALLARARALGLRGRDGRIHLLAIAGDRSTPVSIARNEGMRRAVNEAEDAALEQVLFADWKRELAQERMAQRLQQGAPPQVVWAGSDQMAFGAMEAAQAQGLVAGKDLLFSGINTSAEAMQAVMDGRLAALSAGTSCAGLGPGDAPRPPSGRRLQD